jgi:hypothetical protein
MEPGSYFQALAATDVAVVRAFLDAGMSASDPVAGSGPPLIIALHAGNACAPTERSASRSGTSASLHQSIATEVDARAPESSRVFASSI